MRETRALLAIAIFIGSLIGLYLGSIFNLLGVSCAYLGGF